MTPADLFREFTHDLEMARQAWASLVEWGVFLRASDRAGLLLIAGVLFLALVQSWLLFRRKYRG